MAQCETSVQHSGTRHHLEVPKLTSAVAEHYNKMPERTRTERQALRTAALRKYNNLVKRALIEQCSGAKRIVDLGAGKGGDLFKWATLGASKLLLVDVASDSLQHADMRYQHNRACMGSMNIFLRCASMAEPFEEELRAQFDAVSCMFALHYAFCEETVRNVAHVLRPGGKFVGTIVHSGRLHTLSPLNELCSVEWIEGSADDEYYFTLCEAVERVRESLVHWHVLVRWCAKYGLRVHRVCNFTDLVTPKSHMSADELEVARLYVAFVFVRTEV